MDPVSVPTEKMTEGEFLAWAQQQTIGRYELHDGRVVAMAPERARHVAVKFELTLALRQAIRAAGLTCQAYVDGLGVRISDGVLYEPDALVRCGEPLDGDAVEVSDPVIVVEVLSPSGVQADFGRKLVDYFRLPSLHHYVILDPDGRRLIHHARQPGSDAYLTRVMATGPFLFEPPGIEIRVEDVFAGLPTESEEQG